RELRDDPAVRDLVVEDHRVAVIVVLTVAAEAAPERVDRHRAVDGRARLVEDREVGVDGLHVVVRTHVAVRVRGCRENAEGAGGRSRGGGGASWGRAAVASAGLWAGCGPAGSSPSWAGVAAHTSTRTPTGTPERRRMAIMADSSKASRLSRPATVH